MMKKFTSRKFLAMVAGVVTGIGVIIAGDTATGITAVIASVVSYLIAEGYIDAKAVNTVKDVVDDVAAEVEDKVEDKDEESEG